LVDQKIPEGMFRIDDSSMDNALGMPIVDQRPQGVLSVSMVSIRDQIPRALLSLGTSTLVLMICVA
jgi:hypothetical protein